MHARHTGNMPQIELDHLIVDTDIVHVVLDYCWYARAVTEVGVGPWSGSGRCGGGCGRTILGGRDHL